MEQPLDEKFTEVSLSDENGGIRQMSGYLALALFAIILGGVSDLILDRPERWFSPHVVFELMLIAGAVGTTAVLGIGWMRARRSVVRLTASLQKRQAERDAWQASAQRALEGFGAAIASQFKGWNLTPAERDVALLLLKGYSHKRIARETSRSERTVRQHAAAAYQKAGVGSRAELAAFFLEGVVLPQGEVP